MSYEFEFDKQNLKVANLKCQLKIKIAKKNKGRVANIKLRDAKDSARS